MSREDLEASSAGLVCGGGQEAPREMRRGKGGEKKRCGRAWREERRITFWRNDSRRGLGWVGDGRSFFLDCPWARRNSRKNGGNAFFGEVFFRKAHVVRLSYFGKGDNSMAKRFFFLEVDFLAFFSESQSQKGPYTKRKTNLEAFPPISLIPLPSRI